MDDSVQDWDLKVSELWDSFFWWTAIVFFKALRLETYDFKALRLETYDFLNCIEIWQKETLQVW